MFESNELERLLKEAAAGFEPLSADAPAADVAMRALQVTVRNALAAAGRGEWRGVERGLVVAELRAQALAAQVADDEALVDAVAGIVLELRTVGSMVAAQ